MKIYTRTGDRGQTSLWGVAGDRRVSKHDRRVEAYGTVDEANAALGVARAELGGGELADDLAWVQHRLFALGADLATVNPARQHHIRAEDVQHLEARIDAYEAQLPRLRQFILPGGTRAAALLHLARTIVRRAERRVVALYEHEPGPPELLEFLNRLSDLLFVMTRAANQAAGRSDEPAEF
ncbi:MAG: cob(I)yrinic acid a,c-diamide adenosyltransferase [Actinomycetia bacterium]|jgi:cob(I)alamin adenosyltransferase|nr:cob(I)yrinic acid a,c-diamide adenosyltransferase [Actinomycetes bacterium]